METDITLIHVDAIKKSYQKKEGFLGVHQEKVRALKRMTLKLEGTGIFGVFGESGCGKSTLARLLVGLEDPDAGEILFNGYPVVNHVPLVHRQRLGRRQLVFQNPSTSLNPRFQIFKILSEGLRNQGLKKQIILKKVQDILLEVQLPESLLQKYPHQLSGGEKQRIAIARALLMEPYLLVLDEPTSSLDTNVQKQILELIRRIVKKRNMVTVFISHDLSVIRYMCDYVYVLKDGEMVEQGSCSHVFLNPKADYTKILVDAALGG